MDKIIEALNEVVLSNQAQTKVMREELEELKKLTISIQKQAASAENHARSAEKQANAAWELVVITRNQVKEEIDYLKKPFWKKVLGI